MAGGGDAGSVISSGPGTKPDRTRGPHPSRPVPQSGGVDRHTAGPVCV